MEFINNRSSKIGGMPKTTSLLEYMKDESSGKDSSPEEVNNLGAIKKFFGSPGINVGDYYEPWFYMSDGFLRLVRSEFGKIEEGRPLFLRLIPDNDFSEDSQSYPSSAVGIDNTSAHCSVQFTLGENILPKESDQTHESHDESLDISSTGVPTSICISDLINRSAVIELFDYFEKLEHRLDPRLVRGIFCDQDRFKLGNVPATNIFIDNKLLIAQHRSSIRRREQQNKLVIGNAELVIDKNMKFNGDNFKLTMFVCSEIIDNVSTLKLYTLNSNGRWECISPTSRLRKSANEINQILENTANIFSLCYSLTE
ncbi:hypothetical protein THOM_0718 [Trachipleistophora hominis]|uniref:Uncharacterized protein n=1 Tax=Trachipleistophora hominis TaxID=72359 RepID=L7JXX4_TRAHO|nr:hypothetical protein THOM_0718 [Trachipleistophora hominis]